MLADPVRSEANTNAEKGWRPADAIPFLDFDLRWTLIAIVAALTAGITPAATATVFFRTGFIHVDRPAVQILAIKFEDRPIPFGVVGHFDESEAPGLSGVSVGHDADPINGTVWFKQRSNRIFGSTEAEVSYKNILHVSSLLNCGRTVNPGRIGRGLLNRTRRKSQNISELSKLHFT